METRHFDFPKFYNYVPACLILLQSVKKTTLENITIKVQSESDFARLSLPIVQLKTVFFIRKEKFFKEKIEVASHHHHIATLCAQFISTQPCNT